MRTRLCVWSSVILLSVALTACGSDDTKVATGDEPPESVTSTSTTVDVAGSEDPPTDSLTVEDVIAAFEEEGYSVSEFEADAPVASPSGGTWAGLEVGGGDLSMPTKFELWVFTDAEAAQEGADEVIEEATDPQSDGGGFVSTNGAAVGYFSCTCEDDSMLASAFEDLDLSVADGSGSGSGTDPDPSEEGLAEDLDAVIELLEAAGLEVTVLDGGSGASGDTLDSGELALSTARGIESTAEVYVYPDRVVAEDAAEAMSSEWDEECGACDEVPPVFLTATNVVFVLDGDDLSEVITGAF